MSSEANPTSDTVLTPRDRLVEICQTLPDVIVEDVDGERHLIFKVRNRTFAYYIENHHGDGEIALHCKAEPGMNTALIEQDPRRFYMPAYIGHRGWIAARLAIPETDWDEIADLVIDSYCLIAPKRLAGQVSRGSF